MLHSQWLPGPLLCLARNHALSRRGVHREPVFEPSLAVDVDSYLPYEGKVVLRNKQAHTALVRIPGWVELGQVRNFVDGKPMHPPLAGRYEIFEGLKPNDEIRLEFRVKEEMDRYTIDDKEYHVTFRGSTVVDIDPRDTDAKDYPMYQRDSMKADKAPMREVKRFVADRIIPLGTY